MHLSGDNQGDVVMATTRQIVEESNRLGVQFLIADLSVALTFLDVAETTRSEEVRKRNRDNARTAYDAVQRFLGRLSPSKEEQTELDARLSTLRSRLRGLGYVLDSAGG
jgi:hypothetical protein